MLQSSKRKLLWAELLSIMVAKANSVMNSCSQPRHREIIILLSLKMAKRQSHVVHDRQVVLLRSSQSLCLMLQSVRLS